MRSNAIAWRAVTRPEKAADDPAFRQRQAWMDVLRGICILLVLSLHASLIVARFDATPWQPLVEFNQLFAPYRMPTLMFLSGLLLAQSLRKSLLDYVDGKVRHIAYPYVVWTCIFGLVVTPSFEWHNPWLWMGASYLWYLFFLLICYAVAPFLQPINSLYVALACILLSCLMPDGTKYQERLFCLMGYFFLGHFVATHRAVMETMLSKYVLLFSLPVALGLSLFAQWGDGLSYRAELVVATLAGIVVLMHLARWLSGLPVSRPLKFVGFHSLVYYVAHYPVMYLAAAFMLDLAAPPAGITLAAVNFSLALLFCTGLALLCSRQAMVRMLFVMPFSPAKLITRSPANR